MLERRLRFGGWFFGGFGEIESINDKTNVVVQLNRLRAGLPFRVSLFTVERGNDPTQTASAGNDAIDFRDLGAPVETGAVRPDFSPVQKNGRNSGIGIGSSNRGFPSKALALNTPSPAKSPAAGS